MGISEREYAEMLRRNGGPEGISVKNDSGHGPTPEYYHEYLEANADSLGIDVPPPLAAAQAMGVKGITVAPTEHEEQVALFQWAEMAQAQYPELDMLFAVPNGGYRPMTTAAQLKAEGVKPGVPDVCLPVARGHFYSLWIEMKRKPNTTSDAQRMWLDALRHYGHCAVVCWSAQEAISTIMAYLAQES